MSSAAAAIAATETLTLDERRDILVARRTELTAHLSALPPEERDAVALELIDTIDTLADVERRRASTRHRLGSLRYNRPRVT